MERARNLKMSQCNCMYYLLMMCLVIMTVLTDEETHSTAAASKRTTTEFTMAPHIPDITDQTSNSYTNRCRKHDQTTNLCTECIKGFYGNTCNMTCNTNCNARYCKISTGACKYGCVNNTGNSGTSTWYGQDCSMRCNGNCSVGRCFRNGTCFLGCKNGTYGAMCDKTCLSNCQGSCSVKGVCLGDCTEGFYGPYCNTSCSKTCNGSVCYKNGTCHSCSSRYQGYMCEGECPQQCKTCHQFGTNCTSCVPGRYGTKCTSTCGGCHGACEFQDGQCSSGCRPGYYGSYCGNHCNPHCHSERSTKHPECDQSTGQCVNGCTRGWYGRHCNQSCNDGCESLYCDRSTGHCSHGCTAGYWGNRCHHKCPQNCAECKRTDGVCLTCTNNTYGRRCENLCAGNCHDNSCNMSGTCTSGCVSGYYGDTCGTDCDRHCSTCDMYNGTCITCSPGWTGVNCKNSTKIAVFYVMMVVLFISTGCILMSLIYMLMKRYQSEWIRRLVPCGYSVCNSDNRQSWKSSPQSKTNWKSKRLTLLDEENNVLPQFTREKISALLVSNQRKSKISKMNRCSFDNKILLDNENSQVMRYSGSQHRWFEDHRYQWDLSPCVCIEPTSELSGHGRGVSKVSVRNHENGQCEMYWEGKMSSLDVQDFDIFGTVCDYRCKDNDSVSSETVESSSSALTVTVSADELDPTLSLYTSMDAHQRYVDSICFDKPGHKYVESSEESFEKVRPQMSPCRGHVALDAKVWPTSVDCKNFNHYVKSMKRQGCLDMQFKGLPDGELAVCTESKRPENETKNRFTNIHPYDHSRVILHDTGGDRSDYINASYVNGYGKPRFFIATQGPFGDNTDTFLSMVYQCKATAIVMLTNLFENNRMKCGKYWPDVGCSRHYGDSLVHNVQEEAMIDYCVRTVTIQQEGREQHTLSQYHYTSWPDHGQPDDPRSLLDFYMDVKTSAFGEGPVVVHCSAGIGRTGTFLALDYLLDQASAEGIVDVYECVKRLRYQRMNMVQNKVQYTFLHDLVALALAECQV